MQLLNFVIVAQNLPQKQLADECGSVPKGLDGR